MKIFSFLMNFIKMKRWLALDRVSHFRKDAQWLAEAKEKGKFVSFSAGKFGFTQNYEPMFETWQEASKRAVEEPVLLGVSQNEPVWTVRSSSLPECSFVQQTLRSVMGRATEETLSVLVPAQSLLNWTEGIHFCPLCGKRMMLK